MNNSENRPAARYVSDNTELITNAVEYVKNNAYNCDVSVADISVNAGFSTDYFNRIFLSHTGFTAMAYVNYIRTKKAAALLRDPKRTILDIALEVGYDSHEGFIKAFKKYYGMTPSEYREQKKNSVFFSCDFADKTVGVRFVHDNPDFKLIEQDSAIRYLLEKDPKRYGHFCTNIKYMGYSIAAPNGDMENGFVFVSDDLQGGTFINLVTDDIKQLAEWIKRFPNAVCFHSPVENDVIKSQLAEYGVDFELIEIPQCVFLGEKLPCTLPEGLTIRTLSYDDREHIVKWAGDKNGEHTKSWGQSRPESFINVLLNSRIYSDEGFTVYGAFQNGELIAVTDTMAEEVMGYRQNDSLKICFGADCEPTDELYKAIYSYITNDLLDRGILPLEDVQYGEYARSHGNFTAEDLGFTVVNRIHRIKCRLKS